MEAGLRTHWKWLTPWMQRHVLSGELHKSTLPKCKDLSDIIQNSLAKYKIQC